MAIDFGSLVNRDLSNIQSLRNQREIAQQRKDEIAYRRGRDKLSDARYADELKYRRSRDKLSDMRYDAETAYKKDRDLISDKFKQDKFEEDTRRWNEQFKLNKMLNSAQVRAAQAQARSASERATLAKAKAAREKQMMQAQQDMLDFNRAQELVAQGKPEVAKKLLEDMDARGSIDLEEIKTLDTANMMKTGKEILEGKIPPDDPRAKELLTQVFSDTMRRTGRDGIYQFDSLEVDPRDESGQSFIVMMKGPDGEVVPATALQTSLDSDPVVSLTTEDLTRALQQKVSMAGQVRDVLARAASQKRLVTTPQGDVLDPLKAMEQRLKTQKAVADRVPTEQPDAEQPRRDFYLQTQAKTPELKYLASIAEQEQWPVSVLKKASQRIRKRIKDHEDNPTTFFGRPKPFDLEQTVQDEIDAARLEIEAEQAKKAEEEAVTGLYEDIKAANPDADISQRVIKRIVDRFRDVEDGVERQRLISNEIRKWLNRDR